MFSIGKKVLKNNFNLTNNEILYVPANSIDLYQGGILRSFPNRLLNTQLEILSILNNTIYNNFKINVKPFRDANIYNSQFYVSI